jgi:hypothetical protein
MTVGEMRFLESVPALLKQILEELKRIANSLEKQ